MTTGDARRNIRLGIEAFNRGDFEAALDRMTEDVQWKRVDGLPDTADEIRGRAALREHLEPDVFAAGRLDVVEMVEGDGVILVHGVFHATGAGSGIEIDTQTYAVYRVTPEGLAWRIENWRERADAERSSGLRLGS
jgi:ketosteroid isomerase-like protein